MRDAHERYEQLAVGHVLGGLGASDAADFRTHLLNCRACRSRVAELRDIAADLAAAERDEKAQARLRTEVPRRVHEDEPEVSAATSSRITVRHVTAATVVVVLLAAAMAFWNLHLRTAVTSVAAVAEQRGAVLEELATGVPVDADLRGGLTGLVVVDEQQVAFTVAGLDAPAPGERYDVWLLGGEDGPQMALRVLETHFDGGVLYATVSSGDATELVMSRERGEPGDGPSGEVVLSAELRPLS